MITTINTARAWRAALAASALCSLAAVAPTAFAAGDVQGPAMSASQANLSAICPGAEAALQDALASAWRRVGYPATVTVQLRVEGRQVEVTQVSGGMVPYRYAVARASSRLDCDTQGAGSRTVAFNVRFVGPDAPESDEAPQRLAKR